MNTTGGSERKVVKITEERMNEVLPPNILESELDFATKKVLAALCDWYLNSPAKESGIVIISNKELVAIACVGGTQLQKALRQLQDYDLVDRIIGTGLGNASQYRIDFIQMMKPLKRKSFAELFNLELEEPESSEKPISTIVQYSVVQSSSDKSSSSYNSSEKSIEDKSIAEEGIPEGTGFDGDLFETKTYLKNGIIKNDYLKENSNIELVRAMEEGMTEPMTKNEEEGKEDPNEYQDNIITSSENQEPSVEGLHEDESQAASPSSLQSNDDEQTQQEEESSTEQPQLTSREEFRKWKKLVDPELNKLKHITTRKLFGEEVKQFYKFYDQTVYDEGFSHDETQKHLESYIDGVINGWEGFQT